jgi:hypothetical protein
MSFHVGQKVVCVDTSPAWPHRRGNAAPISKGLVYTIREVGLTNPADPAELPCVRLCEVLHGNDAPIWAHRFRPVRTTSIEIFQQMLVNPPKEKVS